MNCYYCNGSGYVKCVNVKCTNTDCTYIHCISINGEKYHDINYKTCEKCNGSGYSTGGENPNNLD